MDASSEAADQIVRMTLQGAEVALRITGAGARDAATMLAAAMASSQKTRGKARLAALLRSGKELRVFPIRRADLDTFAREARRYGIVYTVVKQRDDPESVDLLVRAEDASKVNRIAERHGFARVARDAPPREPGSRNGPGEPSKNAPEPEVPSPHRATDAPSLEDLLAPPAKEGGAPLADRPGKGTRSGPTSGRSRPSGGAGEPIPRNGGKPSVRAEMASIAAGRKAPAGGRGARPRAAEKGR